MMRILGAFLAAIVAIFLFTGCESNGHVHVSAGTPPPPPPPPPKHVHKAHGPPPHAPAHGYRHKHADGCDLRYDRMVGCYAVVGYTDYYYNDGAFIRFSGKGWEMSAHIGSGWSAVDVARVPQPLVVKYEGKGHGKGHGKGKKGGKEGHQGNDNKQSAFTADMPIIEARWGKY